MSNTNDPQAPYFRKATPEEVKFAQDIGAPPFPDGMIEVKPTGRAPMLSDADVMGPSLNVGFPYMMSAQSVRDFYEAKITSGELRAAKMTRGIGYTHDECELCDYVLEIGSGMNFCPGCGAQIVKE